MDRKYRSWIPGIVFWALFLGSVAMDKRYGWVDAIWNAVWLLFLLLLSVCGALQIFRNRHEGGGYIGYRGVPRWAVTLFGGEARPSEPSGPK